MLKWEETMSTGVDSVDYQHRMIIERFNELAASIEAGDDAREMAGNTLDFLQFYAQWHFQHEEKCMVEYKCPVAEKNKREHQYFLERFGAFYQKWQTNNMSRELVLQTYFELEDWIANHIMHTDSNLRFCNRATSGK